MQIVEADEKKFEKHNLMENGKIRKNLTRLFNFDNLKIEKRSIKNIRKTDV